MASPQEMVTKLQMVVDTTSVVKRDIMEMLENVEEPQDFYQLSKLDRDFEVIIGTIESAMDRLKIISEQKK